MSVSREYASTSSDIFKLVCEYIQLDSTYGVFWASRAHKIVKSEEQDISATLCTISLKIGIRLPTTLLDVNC